MKKREDLGELEPFFLGKCLNPSSTREKLASLHLASILFSFDKPIPQRLMQTFSDLEVSPVKYPYRVYLRMARWYVETVLCSSCPGRFTCSLRRTVLKLLRRLSRASK